MKSPQTYLQAVLLAVLLFGCNNLRKDARQEPSVAERAALSEVDREQTDNLTGDVTVSGGTQPYSYNWSGNAVPPSGSVQYSLSDANGVTNGLVAGDQSFKNVISSSAALENRNDTIRKFIRTADLKFRVHDVAQATYALEDIALKFDGYVSNTNLYSTIRNKTVTPISPDSSLETIYFTVQNTMRIRVPNTKLDSALKAIAPLVDFLDFRNIRADDVQLQLLRNRLEQERVAKYQKRMAQNIATHGDKLKETTNAEDKMLAQQQEADEALIANLELADKISFSTIELYIYQREGFRRQMIANDKNIEAYQPGFVSRAGDALLFGWKIVQGIALFIINSWSVILMVAGIIIAVRFFWFRRRNGED